MTTAAPSRRMLVLAGCALTVACAARRPASSSALPPATTGLRVALLWSEAADLDLYVTDPRQETVYFANPRSGSGGRLERDEPCGERARARAVESVTWPAPPAGRYRVGVDYHDTCGRTRGAVPFRVVVDTHGRREEATGSLEPAEFRYIVLELDVEEDRP